MFHRYALGASLTLTNTLSCQRCSRNYRRDNPRAMTPVKLYVFGVPGIQAFHSWCNGLPFPCVFLLRSLKSLFDCSEGSPPASSSHWKLPALKARRPSSTLFPVKTSTAHWLRTHAHFSGTAHSLSM